MGMAGGGVGGQVERRRPGRFDPLSYPVHFMGREVIGNHDGQGQWARDGDRLLDVEEAARKLGKSKDYLYRHAGKYPFTVRDGRRLRFSEAGIEKFIRQRLGR